MKRSIVLLTLSIGTSCADKQNQDVHPQSFEDFQSEYFNARQGDELDDACSSWYNDCVAAGYAEEDCSRRLEYCEDGEWGADDREDDNEASECEEVARTAYEECVESGVSAEDCRIRYEQAYNDCEEAN